MIRSVVVHALKNDGLNSISRNARMYTRLMPRDLNCSLDCTSHELGCCLIDLQRIDDFLAIYEDIDEDGSHLRVGTVSDCALVSSMSQLDTETSGAPLHGGRRALVSVFVIDDEPAERALARSAGKEP